LGWTSLLLFGHLALLGAYRPLWREIRIIVVFVSKISLYYGLYRRRLQYSVGIPGIPETNVGMDFRHSVFED
jgi:hypothetical protein